MSEEIRKQVYNNLNQKATDELIEIWQKNDHVAWTEAAFAAVREILLLRLGDLPPQGAGRSSQEYPNNDAIERPRFYQPNQVNRLVNWLNRIAVIAVVVIFAKNLILIPDMRYIVISFAPTNQTWADISWFVAVLLSISQLILESALYYFPLKALTYILKILMEMEFTGREAKV